VTQIEQRFGRIPEQPFGGPAQRATVTTASLPVVLPGQTSLPADEREPQPAG
jgi:hypothetical protein